MIVEKDEKSDGEQSKDDFALSQSAWTFDPSENFDSARVRHHEKSWQRLWL
jgi:hypothetical protein